jgi:hypothetical protein
MAGTTAEVDVFAGGSVVVSAVGAAEVIDGLAGEGFGGETGAGDDNLAVFVTETWGGGLEVIHFLWDANWFGSRLAGISRDNSGGTVVVPVWVGLLVSFRGWL